MNNEEAKFLLQAYRPNGRDAQDPQFADALKQVKGDPGLEQWFRQQQAFDNAVSQKLQSVPVPASLKHDIQAGRKTIRPAAWWSRRSVTVALAACLVAVLGLAALLTRSIGRADFGHYRADMVRFVTDVEEGRESLQWTSTDLSGIRAWIAEHSVHRNVQLPRSLIAGSGLGCRIIDWHEESVALICFRLQSGQVAHLLVINRSSVRNGPTPGAQYVLSLNGMNTTGWSSQDKTFLLISRAPKETLQHLL